VKTDPSGRDVEKVQIIVIKQGYEPPQFTGHFPAWNDDVFAVSLLFMYVFMKMLRLQSFAKYVRHFKKLITCVALHFRIQSDWFSAKGMDSWNCYYRNRDLVVNLLAAICRKGWAAYIPDYHHLPA